MRLTIALLLVNAVVIGALVWDSRHSTWQNNKDGRQRGVAEVSEILHRSLKLTDAQAQQLIVIRADFFKKERELSSSIRAKRDSMNENMFSDKIDTLRLTALAKEIADNEYQMELFRIAQARQLQMIFTPEQLRQLNQVVTDIRDYFQPIPEKK